MNELDVVINPESPACLPGQPIQVYVPIATEEHAGISKFDAEQFDVEDGKVSLNKEFLNDTSSVELIKRAAYKAFNTTMPENANAEVLKEFVDNLPTGEYSLSDHVLVYAPDNHGDTLGGTYLKRLNTGKADIGVVTLANLKRKQEEFPRKNLTEANCIDVDEVRPDGTASSISIVCRTSSGLIITEDAPEQAPFAVPNMRQLQKVKDNITSVENTFNELDTRISNVENRFTKYISVVTGTGNSVPSLIKNVCPKAKIELLGFVSKQSKNLIPFPYITNEYVERDGEDIVFRMYATSDGIVHRVGTPTKQASLKIFEGNIALEKGSYYTPYKCTIECNDRSTAVATKLFLARDNWDYVSKIFVTASAGTTYEDGRHNIEPMLVKGNSLPADFELGNGTVPDKPTAIKCVRSSMNRFYSPVTTDFYGTTNSSGSVYSDSSYIDVSFPEGYGFISVPLYISGNIDFDCHFSIHNFTLSDVDRERITIRLVSNGNILADTKLDKKGSVCSFTKLDYDITSTDVLDIEVEVTGETSISFNFVAWLGEKLSTAYGLPDYLTRYDSSNIISVVDEFVISDMIRKLPGYGEGKPAYLSESHYVKDKGGNYIDFVNKQLVVNVERNNKNVLVNTAETEYTDVSKDISYPYISVKDKSFIIVEGVSNAYFKVATFLKE